MEWSACIVLSFCDLLGGGWCSTHHVVTAARFEGEGACTLCLVFPLLAMNPFLPDPPATAATAGFICASANLVPAEYTAADHTTALQLSPASTNYATCVCTSGLYGLPPSECAPLNKLCPTQVRECA